LIDSNQEEKQMKQKVVTETISSLKQGNIIRIQHTDDLEIPFSEGEHEATVMGTERGLSGKTTAVHHIQQLAKRVDSHFWRFYHRMSGEFWSGVISRNDKLV
jgi:hypothetical protein